MDPATCLLAEIAENKRGETAQTKGETAQVTTKKKTTSLDGCQQRVYARDHASDHAHVRVARSAQAAIWAGKPAQIAPPPNEPGAEAPFAHA